SDGRQRPEYQIPSGSTDTQSYIPGSSLPGFQYPGLQKPGDRLNSEIEGVLPSQVQPAGAIRFGGGDSASSQTQIQTGLEGTAAEASSAGQYKGLGSQTQVQGGYRGNGSFFSSSSICFTGGVSQSQVQGGKQGGLSGSSAIVEDLDLLKARYK
ncbi:hypothetical protein TNCT_419981, partial [Trichonephila clavata]